MAREFTDAVNWSAKQYLAFEEQRTRPVRDLLAAVPQRSARRVMDIGCGPGNSTEALKAHYPEAVVSGLDNSSEMLKAARARLPDVDFALADIESWTYREAGVARAAPYDVILANAVLQWVPKHDQLLPELVAKLTSEGVLAVQMPDNFDEPAHVLMREVAHDGPWRTQLAAAGGARPPMREADWYYTVLRGAACRVDIWRTIYHHPLAGGAEAIVEWFKGSGLRPFLAPLAQADKTEFLLRYREAVARAYPVLEDGMVLLPSPRLFLVALR